MMDVKFSDILIILNKQVYIINFINLTYLFLNKIKNKF